MCVHTRSIEIAHGARVATRKEEGRKESSAAKESARRREKKRIFHLPGGLTKKDGRSIKCDRRSLAFRDATQSFCFVRQRLDAACGTILGAADPKKVHPTDDPTPKMHPDRRSAFLYI